MKFQTKWQRHAFKPEYNSKKLCTIPDQDVPTQELLRRYLSGEPLGMGNNLVYTEDEDLPHVERMDIIDYHDMLDNAKAHNENLRSRYAEAKKKRDDENNAKIKQKEVPERKGPAGDTKITNHENDSNVQHGE